MTRSQTDKPSDAAFISPTSSFSPRNQHSAQDVIYDCVYSENDARPLDRRALNRPLDEPSSTSTPNCRHSNSKRWSHREEDISDIEMKSLLCNRDSKSPSLTPTLTTRQDEDDMNVSITYLSYLIRCIFFY